MVVEAFICCLSGYRWLTANLQQPTAKKRVETGKNLNLNKVQNRLSQILSSRGGEGKVKDREIQRPDITEYRITIKVGANNWRGIGGQSNWTLTHDDDRVDLASFT